MPDLPSGTVTFLFTDVEGSTRLLHELGAEVYAEALAEHRRVLREAFTAHSGVEVDTQGDAFFVAFPTAPGAVYASAAALDGLAGGPISIRVGLHTGSPLLTEEGYVGEDVHKGARIAATGHGGQVLLSRETMEAADAEVLDLGEHRLKDFAEPVWIFQLGNERFPPLKTISNTTLPRPASSFVGRDMEVQEIVALLRDGVRLLTLTGPGGSGKTRLAIEAAAELVPEFRNGVYWVGLAALRDPRLVLDTIAQSIGAKDGLASYVSERELLLLLDNLEQIVEAAPDLATLVETCPNLTLLVTSRELLRVRGEVGYPVSPLAEPDAVELFCARARTEPDHTIHQLCRALDNLPLAVELAAARASVLSPQEMLGRLSGRLDLLKGGRDADPRQATLRATIDWSYELLGPAEQRLFARSAVFAGGCTLESAEEVCAANLDDLQSLVDKSLLRHTDRRFWMLETIREYAADRLAHTGEAGELRGRHAQHFLSLAEEAEPHVEDAMHRGGSGEWPDRLARELDNLRTALDELEASGETERALDMAGALSEFWERQGLVLEGRDRLERALRSDDRPTAGRARALLGAASLAARGGDPATTEARAEEALTLYRTFGNPRGMALSYWAIGYAAVELGDLTRAQQLLSESLRRFRELGDEHDALWLTRTLAWAYAESGDLDGARELYEDGLHRAHELMSRAVEAGLLDSLGWLAVKQGRARDALPLVRESLGIKRELGDRGEIAISLCCAARALATVGRVTTATRLLSSFDALTEDAGGGEPWVTRMKEEALATIRTQLDEATFSDAWEQGRRLTVDGAVALALDALDDAC